MFLAYEAIKNPKVTIRIVEIIIIILIIGALVVFFIYLYAKEWVCSKYGYLLRPLGLCGGEPQSCTIETASQKCGVGGYCCGGYCRLKCNSDQCCPAGQTCNLQTGGCEKPVGCKSDQQCTNPEFPYCRQDQTCVQCMTQDHCKIMFPDGSRPYCVNGQCSSQTPCQDDNQCGGYKCVNKKCQFTCQNKDGCKLGYRCEGSQCVPDFDSCKSSSDCGHGQVCNPETHICELPKSFLLTESNSEMTPQTPDKNLVNRLIITNASPFSFYVKYNQASYSYLYREWSYQSINSNLPATSATKKDYTAEFGTNDWDRCTFGQGCNVDSFTFSYESGTGPRYLPVEFYIYYGTSDEKRIASGTFDGVSGRTFFPSDASLEKYIQNYALVVTIITPGYPKKIQYPKELSLFGLEYNDTLFGQENQSGGFFCNTSSETYSHLRTIRLNNKTDRTLQIYLCTIKNWTGYYGVPYNCKADRMWVQVDPIPPPKDLKDPNNPSIVTIDLGNIPGTIYAVRFYTQVNQQQQIFVEIPVKLERRFEETDTEAFNKSFDSKFCILNEAIKQKEYWTVSTTCAIDTTRPWEYKGKDCPWSGQGGYAYAASENGC